jgi:nickel-dependent lactate racemase
LIVRLPPNWSLTTLEPKPSTPLPDLRAAVEGALAQPLSSPRLIDLASSTTRVCLIFTDATRACPDDVLVPAILRELDRAGVPADHITLLCATGLHRPSTREEKIARLGPDVVEHYRVIDHDPFSCVILSRAAAKDPDVEADKVQQDELPRHAQQDIFVNALLLDSDLIIATGVVEPHQYAGYSGGGKAVVIGCGSEETIGLTHGPQFLDQPGVRLGQIEGNPFQRFVRDTAQVIGVRFVVNIVLDGPGRAIAVQAGDPIAAHDALIAVARSVYEVPIAHDYDVVIAQVDAPKDVNLYQASRAVTTIALSATPPLKPGGAIVLAARCPEGAGQGRGEQRFFAALSQASDLSTLLADFRRNGCRPGEQRTYLLAQVLLHTEVIVAGSQCPEVVQACHMRAAASLDEALDWLYRKHSRAARVLFLPHPLHTLPSMSTSIDAH